MCECRSFVVHVYLERHEILTVFAASINEFNMSCVGELGDSVCRPDPPQHAKLSRVPRQLQLLGCIDDLMKETHTNASVRLFAKGINFQDINPNMLIVSNMVALFTWWTVTSSTSC